MSKHTWETDGDSPSSWSVESTDWRVVVLDACGGLIADCTDGHESDEGFVMAAKCEDVARLIAAAPELLEALREADEDFAREGFHETGPYRAPILAAIAKATGEA